VSASDYVSTFRGEGVEPDLVALPVPTALESLMVTQATRSSGRRTDMDPSSRRHLPAADSLRSLPLSTRRRAHILWIYMRGAGVVVVARPRRSARCRCARLVAHPYIGARGAARGGLAPRFSHASLCHRRVAEPEVLPPPLRHAKGLFARRQSPSGNGSLFCMACSHVPESESASPSRVSGIGPKSPALIVRQAAQSQWPGHFWVMVTTTM
jgi:hypothetical protein